LLCLTACNFFGYQYGFKNTPPNDFKVELSLGFSTKEKGLIEISDNDVYINIYQKDNYNTSYFAHFDNDSYVYYRKDVMNNGDWESYSVETNTSKNMTTLDAIKSLEGTISGLYADIFDVELINGARSSGETKVIGIETTMYKVKSRTYYYMEGINKFLKIFDESDEEQSLTVKDYQYWKHFDDSPSFN
jgi:hypothetical protein